ncbi:MAG: hypothetical protein JRI61_04430 [Deltaproteobacteria bacterium]|nr:hypothetical protein [Deltaproteobacteria bacterium]
MKKAVVWIIFISFLLLDVGIAFSEWQGYVKQGYQSWKQFFNPQEINSPIDATSGATPTVNESGPVTEMETLWDFKFLRGTATTGLFGRVLWYSESTYDYLILPVIRYRDIKHTLDVGRYRIETWGSGLLISKYPAGGARYANYCGKFETRIFNHSVIEYSDFQKIDARYFGISETYRFHRGKTGFMYVYDNTNPFYDASRAEISQGNEVSLYANWTAPSNWFLQGEFAYAEAPAAFAGLDIPISKHVTFQAKTRFMGSLYNPLLSRFARGEEKQIYYIAALPLQFFSEQLSITPEWGVKQQENENYWLPGIKIEGELFDSLWLAFRIKAEQPFSEWGEYRHYEYTEAGMGWMINKYLYMNLKYSKTFNGFVDWKEIRTLATIEGRW